MPFDGLLYEMWEQHVKDELYYRLVKLLDRGAFYQGLGWFKGISKKHIDQFMFEDEEGCNGFDKNKVEA